ncbi:hypothetical protein COU54_01020 [Candidatus Pacearchaeota archaeon CG10_big_fil_rev_8_21_14_0_10_31_24]|nr:MAG: hypothetical protein COU54_01020 [Candidatus Pacearchaeota archaeon CG10_big_fil_rev_8_21_14_0_10_31_24]
MSTNGQYRSGSIRRDGAWHRKESGFREIVGKYMIEVFPVRNEMESSQILSASRSVLSAKGGNGGVKINFVYVGLDDGEAYFLARGYAQAKLKRVMNQVLGNTRLDYRLSRLED